MFKGFVLSESLKNPKILNDFKTEYVKIEKHPESEHKFWHLFKIEIPDKKIKITSRKFSREMKHGWYCHFWNRQFVYLCFKKKTFKLLREKDWKSKEFREAVEYGAKHGVDSMYFIDFWIED